jgi:hypothetical protein
VLRIILRQSHPRLLFRGRDHSRAQVAQPGAWQDQLRASGYATTGVARQLQEETARVSAQCDEEHLCLDRHTD